MAVHLQYPFSEDKRSRLLSNSADLTALPVWDAFLQAAPQRLASETIDCIERSTPTPHSPEQARALDQLRHGPCRMVITGQQLGLFGGPAFNIYKILTVIALREQILGLGGEYDIVPLFWLQTEDHDLKEINQLTFPTSTSELATVACTLANFENRASLGEVLLPADIDALRSELREHLHFHPHAAEALHLIDLHYTVGHTWADAFSRLLSELFRETGLLFYNPRNETLPLDKVWRTALTERANISALLNEHQKQNPDIAQVGIRTNSPLFFLERVDASRSRYRLVEDSPGKFTESGGELIYSEAELSAILEHEPHRFSSSALLRPLVQESLFPNALYVGGRAESRYFQQTAAISPLFGHAHAPFIVTRASFLVIDPKIAEILDEFHCAPLDVRLRSDQLTARAAALLGLRDPVELKQSTTAAIATCLEELRQPLSAAEQTLETPLEKTRGKIEQALNSLFERYDQAIVRKNGVLTQKIERAALHLFPRDEDQERVIGGIFYLARYGSSFLEQLLDEIRLGDENTIEMRVKSPARAVGEPPF